MSFWVAAILALLSVSVHAAGKAQHVVVVVWDGLRPDSVTEKDTPTLARLAREGVVFAQHHAVYQSATVVNGVALATGAHPARSGVLANREYRPAFDPLRSVAIDSWNTIRKGDELTGGRYLQVPTIVEVLREAGRSTAVAGTKRVVELFDRKHPSGKDYAGPRATPNTVADAESTRELIAKWGNRVPQFSLLWLSEPDYTQHATAPGSPQSLNALKGSDDNLALVLAELKKRGVRDKADVFVVSDHGFSTIARAVDVAKSLRKAGFNAVTEFKDPPVDGDVMVVPTGGSVMLYVIGRDDGLIGRLVEFLQQQDFTGVIFTREALPGTFALAQARLNSVDAPDILVSLRWSDESSPTGKPGSLVTTGRGPAQGHHASLSRYDLHNTLIVAGPDFSRGMTNALPTGNTDLMPTILAILGVKAPSEGRVLKEAMVGEEVAPLPIVIETLEATRDLGRLRWHQYLRVIAYAGGFYLGEGNGAVQVIQTEEKPVTP